MLGGFLVGRYASSVRIFYESCRFTATMPVYILWICDKYKSLVIVC